mgnify:CR=1 FL=1
MIKNCCKKCGSEKFIKNGFVRGLQRYRCRECRCNFTYTKRRGIHPALRALSIVLYGMCGVSMYKIAKLLGVSDVAVLKWIRKEENLIEEALSHAESKIALIDKNVAFCEWKKKKVWVWRAIDGVSRRPLGWELGTRGDSCCKRLMSVTWEG